MVCFFGPSLQMQGTFCRGSPQYAAEPQQCFIQNNEPDATHQCGKSGELIAIESASEIQHAVEEIWLTT